MEQVDIDRILLPECWSKYLARVATGHLVETKQRITHGQYEQVFWACCMCGWASSRTWDERSDAWYLDALLHRMWYAQTAIRS